MSHHNDFNWLKEKRIRITAHVGSKFQQLDKKTGKQTKVFFLDHEYDGHY